MFAVSLTEDQFFDALGAYLTAYLPDGGTVFKSQQNRVAQPPDPSIELTPITRTPLDVPVSTYDGSEGICTQTVSNHVRIEVQADFYGDSMGDVARAVVMVWRSISAPDGFPPTIAPLYCSDEFQSPFVSGEKQYSERWTVRLALQYNASVTLPQQSFNTVAEPAVTLKAADINF